MNGIDIQNLCVDIGGFSLKNVSLKVPRGTIMGLVGKNGAGKTTLIKTISDCYKIQSGSIRINGLTYYDDEAGVKRSLGVVFDESYLNSYLVFSKRIIKRIKKAYPYFNEVYFLENLERFGLDRKKSASKYSLGMKKKLNTIFILSQNPDVLILDEPTSGVDPADRYELLDLIQEFLQDETKTVLLSTHITSDLDRIADYITLIDDGRVIFSEEKEFLKEKYLIIQTDRNTLTDEEFNKLLGVKENSFGIEGLTADKTLCHKKGVISKTPSIEEIMIYLTGNIEREVNNREV